MTPSKKTAIPCTICGRMTDYFTDPTGPFCSKRCQLVDFGKWMNEDYRVSEPLRPEHFVEDEDGEEG
ncbi:MAG TPA: DNA gyrase inhibitor YacG [Chthoniobacteraceae bacterium]|jgi:endogenous inhibitor of DNA gyrase (YacG/DUF329 family)|nr:DNA gyrase inhibitor YacG [Chthoniobacteraceae bacterium]